MFVPVRYSSDQQPGFCLWLLLPLLSAVCMTGRSFTNQFTEPVTQSVIICSMIYEIKNVKEDSVAAFDIFFMMKQTFISY